MAFVILLVLTGLLFVAEDDLADGHGVRGSRFCADTSSATSAASPPDLVPLDVDSDHSDDAEF